MKRKKKTFIDSRKWYRYQFFGTATVTVPKENIVVDASIANISFSGIGVYSSIAIGKNKKVNIKVSFINKNGKVCEDSTTGKVDWQTKFKNIYFLNTPIFSTSSHSILKRTIAHHAVEYFQ